MAERLTTGRRGRPKGSKNKDKLTAPPPGEEGEDDQVRGEGDNSAEMIREYFDRLHELSDRQESVNGEFRADMKEVYEKAAAELGMPRKVLRHKYAIERAKRKIAAREAEFEASEAEALRTLSDALGGGLGDYAASRAEELEDA